MLKKWKIYHKTTVNFLLQEFLLSKINKIEQNYPISFNWKKSQKSGILKEKVEIDLKVNLFLERKPQ